MKRTNGTSIARGIGVLALGLMVSAGTANAAQTVHLTITIDGNQLTCDSTIVSMGREGTIEGLLFAQTIFATVDQATGQPTGERRYRPIVLRKRIDRCSPLLMKALNQREPVEGTFRFYRPNPSGDGSTEQFFTVEIARSYIVGVSIVSPDVTDPATVGLPPTEEVSFVYGTIKWTYETEGVEFGPFDVVAPR